jgi:hypothetical protein
MPFIPSQVLRTGLHISRRAYGLRTSVCRVSSFRSVSRAVSPKLSELWGQTVTVENHPGAGSTAAPALVAKSPADGYTLLVNTSAQAYSAVLVKNLPYDPLKDFIAVAPLTLAKVSAPPLPRQATPGTPASDTP